MKKICSVTSVVIILFCVSVASVFADVDLDYIKGRPMSQKEIQQQKEMEPELSELFTFKDGTIPLENSANSSFGRTKRQNIPSKYDVRDQSYAKYVKVKNQRNTGLCWAFSASTVAEISYLKQQNTSAANLHFSELSPTHLGYFLFNRSDDPLGNTGQDKNIIKDSGVDYRNFGGNNYMTFQALANWGGFALESKAPFNNGLTKTYDASLAYEDEVHVTDAEFISDTVEAKQAILKNGAAVIEMYFGNENLNYDTSAYYDATGQKGGNHAVTLVGWDDNYKKENFSEGYSWLDTPSQDGAWIVQNSYGAQWGDGGYFYISYEDKSLGNALTFDVQSADTYDYNYQYDGNVLMQYGFVNEGEKLANIYEVKGSDTVQKLKAIGFTDWNEKSTSYNVKVYTDLKKKTDPASGVEQASFDVTTAHTGYHTFTIPSEKDISLNPGSSYSIVITMKSTSKFGLESASNAYKDIDFEAGQQKNQSFWFHRYGNTWDDLYDTNKSNSCSARIKGYTTVSKEEPPKEDPIFGTNIWIRLSGNTRYETSLTIADALKKSLKIDKFDTIIVACGDNFPDALTGSYLAKEKKAPILLVGTDSNTEKKIQAYVEANLSETGTVYILGGEGAVTKRFENGLGKASVKRLAGNDRYQTNQAILKEVSTSGKDLLLCSGKTFPDSLSASATGKPILLVDDRLTSSQKTTLRRQSGRFYLIGGTGAVSQSVESECKKIGHTLRVAGTDRYKTSIAVAEQFFGSETENVALARAYNFPDGLAGGPFALSMKAPLLLVENTEYVDAKQYLKKNNISKGFIFGGKGALEDNLAKNLFQ